MMEQNVKWSTAVRLLTMVCWVLLEVACFLLLWKASWWSLFWAIVIVAALIYGACQAPMRLKMDEDALLIDCLGRTLKLPYAEIESVDPYLLRGTEFRLWGSGGFMGYTGLFYRKDIGRFHAYVGSWRQAFIVTTRQGKKYVLSCEEHDQMMLLLKERIA